MIAGLLSRFGAWLVAALAIAAAFFTAYRSGASVGKANAVQADNDAAATRDANEVRAAAATEVQTVKEANDVLTNINKLPDGSASGELRDKWSRD